MLCNPHIALRQQVLSDKIKWAEKGVKYEMASVCQKPGLGFENSKWLNINHYLNCVFSRICTELRCLLGCIMSQTLECPFILLGSWAEPHRKKLRAFLQASGTWLLEDRSYPWSVDFQCLAHGWCSGCLSEEHMGKYNRPRWMPQDQDVPFSPLSKP